MREASRILKYSALIITVLIVLACINPVAALNSEIDDEQPQTPPESTGSSLLPGVNGVDVETVKLVVTVGLAICGAAFWVNNWHESFVKGQYKLATAHETYSAFLKRDLPLINTKVSKIKIKCDALLRNPHVKKFCQDYPNLCSLCTNEEQQFAEAANAVFEKYWGWGIPTRIERDWAQDAFTRAVRDRIEVHKDFLRVVLPQNHNLNLGKCELPQVPRICSSKEIAKVTNEVKTYIAAEEAVFAEYEKNKFQPATVDTLYNTITQTDEKIAKVSNYLTEEVPATSIVIDFNKLVGNPDL